MARTLDARTRAALLALGLAACGSGRGAVDAGPDAFSDCTSEGEYRCNGSTYEACLGGVWTTQQDCPAGCTNALGCVACNPGELYCQDGNVWRCALNGTPEALVETCAGVNTCEGGGCVDACATAAASKSYIGCEYWAVDLDNAVEVLGFANGGTCAQGEASTRRVCFRSQGANSDLAGLCDAPDESCPPNYTCTSLNVCALDAHQSPFAIVVSNPQARDVDVTVTGPGGELVTQTVAAGQVAAILPQQNGAIPDQSVDGTILARRAYKVTSTLPIVAYQFNPLDNVDVFSNDASLLLPRTAYDTSYYAMTWPTLDRRIVVQNVAAESNHPYRGYVTVVAWTDGTEVTVTPTVAVAASSTQQTIAAGAATTFTLDAFEVLQLQASGAGDLTGTLVTSPNLTTFGVFAGHEAARIAYSTPPSSATTQGPCCADHLEEMMFPASTWGKTFAIARSQPRLNEGDVIRVLAQRPGTSVSFTPAPAAGTCGVLAAGQFCEVTIAGDTAIEASEPVLVGHYLHSAIWSNTANTTVVGSGDPSLAIAVPVEQHRRDYTILVPADYDASYVSIATGASGGVFVDGAAVTLEPFPGGAPRRGARLPVTAGQHTITCPDACSVLVHGYSANGVSYMFAGGLDLKPIVIF